MIPPPDVLLVEDNPGDVLLVQESFAGLDARLSVVGDGEQALAALRRSKPRLVLLDLNLPRRPGLEVLEEMKRDPALSSIPVVVLTSSRAPHDIEDSYDLGANAYVAKPRDFDSFAQAIRSIAEFWLSTALLPRSE